MGSTARRRGLGASGLTILAPLAVLALATTACSSGGHAASPAGSSDTPRSTTSPVGSDATTATTAAGGAGSPAPTTTIDLAAEAGEWAVSGAFQFGATEPQDMTGKLKQAFANGFLGVDSFGRSTFATVGEATDAEIAR